MRREPNKLDELLHPGSTKTALKQAKVLTRGSSPLLRVPLRDKLDPLPMMLPNGMLPASVW